jgi:tRNA(Ile)-lysidine synthase
MNTWKRLAEAIDALSLPAGTGILVATSGGPDSVALALAFHSAALDPAKAWRLCLGHVNHDLRGADSDADEAFVLELGRRLGITVESVRVDTMAYASQHKLSIETAARDLRYRELHRMVQTWGGDVIAAGHHADDQAETVLMNLTRGTGLDGLLGMAGRSGSIVRPFLQLPKEAIIDALSERGELYRVDHSNDDVTPQRNYFRHRVVPALAEVRPDIGVTIAHTADSLRDDAVYLNAEASRALEHMDVHIEGEHVWASTGVFRALPPALQGRALRMLVGALRGTMRDLSTAQVLLMRDAVTERSVSRELGTQLPHSLRLEVKQERFHLYRGLPDAKSIRNPVELLVPGHTATIFGSFEVVIQVVDTGPERTMEQVVCGPSHALCDADVLGRRLLVRSRRPGDRVRLVHATGSKKLQDLFVDAKIPRTERDRIPVVESPEFIVWIPGFGVDRRAAETPETKRVAHLRFRPFI